MPKAARVKVPNPADIKIIHACPLFRNRYLLDLHQFTDNFRLHHLFKPSSLTGPWTITARTFEQEQEHGGPKEA